MEIHACVYFQWNSKPFHCGYAGYVGYVVGHKLSSGMCKICKPTPVGRPIIHVSGCDGLTERLSSFEDRLPQPTKLGVMSKSCIKGEWFANGSILKSFQYPQFSLTSCQRAEVSRLTEGFIQGKALRSLRTNSLEKEFKLKSRLKHILSNKRTQKLSLLQHSQRWNLKTENFPRLQQKHKDNERILPFLESGL